jgi:hypothetical protein
MNEQSRVMVRVLNTFDLMAIVCLLRLVGLWVEDARERLPSKG